jgi:hypothetical protein
MFVQHIVNWLNEFDVKVAETKLEIVKLLEAGFEWIGKDNDGLTYFRRRK